MAFEPDSVRTEYCFHGAYERKVDAKGRFNLPFRFRRGGGTVEDEAYVVSPGTDGSLAVFPKEEWDQTFHRMRSRSSAPEWRANVRKFSAQSFTLAPDSQGRVSVPLALLKRAGIGRRVMVVGMGQNMELWDPERFESDQEDRAEVDPEFMNEFFV